MPKSSTDAALYATYVHEQAKERLSQRHVGLTTAVTFPDTRTEAEVIAAINAEQARRIALAFR